MDRRLASPLTLIALATFAALSIWAVGAPAARGKRKAAKRTAVSKSHRRAVQMRTVARRGTSSARASRLAVVPQSPANGATVTGTVPWEVRTSGLRITRVEFAVDGAVRWRDRSAPFTYSDGLDTTGLADSRHVLTATAYAPGSRRASAKIVVNVSNPGRPPTSSQPPSRRQPPEPPAPSAPKPAPQPDPEPAPAPAAEPDPLPQPQPDPVPQPEPDPEPAPGPAPPSSPDPSSLYWGAWIGSQLTGAEAPWDMGAVAKFEQMAGKKLSVINFSAPFANCSRTPCSFYNFPVNEFNTIRTHGAIPFYSWGSQSIPVPSTLSEPDFQLSDVISGAYDSYIRNFAEAAKAWGHPFFLRFNWEMNGGWFTWTEGVNGNKPGDYVTAWRHVHDVFTEVGATNATWVWCPNVDPEGRLQDLRSLYPGDSYVDWTGLDGYNWGTNPARRDRWRTFDQLYGSTYERITETIAPDKPMIISEVGSTEYGGSKAAWIEEMLATLPVSYPKVHGLLWFEKYDDGMDWPIETSSSATSAFSAGIQSDSYLGNAFGSLGPGKIRFLPIQRGGAA